MLVLLNIPNLYIYIKNGSCFILFLFLLILPFASFLLYILRYVLISTYLNESDDDVGIIKRIFENGKGWYEYRYEDLINTTSLFNSKVIAKEKILRNAIERSSRIQGIEYLYKSKNDSRNIEIIRRQYFKGVSLFILMQKVNNINNINIKVNRKNKKKAYII
jgi:hypothetical protein